MSERPYTAAELERIAADQQDPHWMEWLSHMSERIDQFLNVTVPDMPDNPWSDEGLNHAEAAALRIFPTMESVDLPENRDISDQFHSYIGEVFRRNFEGEWRNVPDYDDDDHPKGFGPVIRLPYNPEYLAVFQLLTATMFRRTGSQWSRIFGYQAEDYETWKAGRTSPQG
ncbi:hypothetical protein OHA40_23400 [Nocardia sp. NBC_00508]|uniref:hypothetical protein n=1 Tax=Nocardia sp. NBC_00508 TaxID=2975992 RepID=UPI002E8184D4|nr:hypothetical protein [Nocardia sp. NBC_00508]WUD64616.1 hypothetical protein OHA40_23400 [Nocardia sp. NBC_00508]